MTETFRHDEPLNKPKTDTIYIRLDSNSQVRSMMDELNNAGFAWASGHTPNDTAMSNLVCSMTPVNICLSNDKVLRFGIEIEDSLLMKHEDLSKSLKEVDYGWSI